MKLLFKKALESSSGPYLALFNYTPLKHGKTPAKLLFNKNQVNDKVLHTKKKKKSSQNGRSGHMITLMAGQDHLRMVLLAVLCRH